MQKIRSWGLRANKAITGYRKGKEIAKRGKSTIKESPAIGIASGIAAAITGVYVQKRMPEIFNRFVELAHSSSPEEFKVMLLKAGIATAGIITASAMAAGGAKLIYGKLKAGVNFKRLKKIVWGKPLDAEIVAGRFKRLGMKEEARQILKWGQGKE